MATRDMFVGSEHTRGLTVVFVEILQQRKRGFEVTAVAGLTRPHAGRLHAHRDVHAVRRAEIIVDPLAAARIAEFFELNARDLFVIWIIASQLGPIETLRVYFRCKVYQPRLAGAVVKPVNAEGEI